MAPTTVCSAQLGQRIARHPRTLAGRGWSFARDRAVARAQQPQEHLASPAAEHFSSCDEQRSQLSQLLLSTPPSILMMSGPHNSGKSTFMRNWAQELSGAYMVNCSIISGTPEAFACALALAVLPRLVPACQRMELFQLLKGPRALQAALAQASLLIIGMAGKENAPLQQAPEPLVVISAVITALEVVHARREHEQPGSPALPTVIVDNFQCLTQWDSQPRHAPLLQHLGALLVAKTKASKSCCFVLVSSKDHQAVMLAQRMRIDDDLSCHLVGNFSKKDAKKFLQWGLSKHVGPEYKLSSDDWNSIYEVLGGNAGDLVAAAAQFEELERKWPAVLKEMRMDRQWRIQAGLCGGDGFNGRDFVEACLYLLEQGGVVPYSKMAQRLGRRTGGSPSQQMASGTHVLHALLQADLLYLRPYSSLASDVPAEMFEGEPSAVTAVTPLELYCMQHWKGKLMEGAGAHVARRPRWKQMWKGRALLQRQHA